MYKLGLLLTVLATAGCNDMSSSAAPAPLTAQFAIKDKFDQEVTSFISGEEITFVIEVKNNTNTEVTYFATGPGYEFMVKKGQTVVWSSFAGLAFAQVITSREIAARDTLRLTAKWSGTDNAGNAVAGGTYEVVPELVFFVDNKRMESPKSKMVSLR